LSNAGAYPKGHFTARLYFAKLVIVLLVALATGTQAHIAKESCHGNANRCRQKKKREEKRREEKRERKESKRREKRWSTTGVEPKSSPVSRELAIYWLGKPLVGFYTPKGNHPNRYAMAGFGGCLKIGH